MKKSLAATLITGLCSAGLLATHAHAQTPGAAQNSFFHQGDILLRGRVIGVLPQNFSSTVSVIGGQVRTTDQIAPELDLSYFLTDHISVEAIAASTRHEVWASHTQIGRVDVGAVWVLPPTVTLQYHFSPVGAFQPYLGAGITVAFFYATQPAGPIVSKVGFSNSIGPALQAGIDYRLNDHWFANFDVKQIFIDTKARINGGAITAKTSLSPTVVGAGIGYRF